MKKSKVYDCTIIELSKHHAPQGNISVVENIESPSVSLNARFNRVCAEHTNAAAFRELAVFVV